MNERARVSNLFIAIERRRPMKPVEQVTAVADRGFAGCIHGRAGSRRQVLLVDSEMLTEFNLKPGMLRENVTTVGLDLARLSAGQQLVIGGATMEVTIPCEPCSHMDEIRVGLQAELKDRRGVLCRVVEGGQISRGDTIEIGEVVTSISNVGGAR